MSSESEKCGEEFVFPFFIKSAAIDGNELWFMDIINNGLCYYDLSERIIKAIYKIPDTPLFGENKYYKMRIVTDKIILFPYFAKNIIIFHKGTKKFKRIDMDIPNIYEGPFLNDSYLFDEMLFVFMLSMQKIVVINLPNEEIVKNIEFPSRMDGEGSYRIQFSAGYAYMQNTRSCQMLKFDMINQMFEQQEMKNDSWQLMAGEGSNPYFMGDYGSFAKWEWGQDRPQTIAQLSTDFKYYVFENDVLQWESYRGSKLRRNFLQQFYDDGRAIWFIPFSSEELVRIDKKTHEMKKMALAGEKEKKARTTISWGKYYLCIDVYHEFLWIYSLKRRLFYKINMETFTYEEIKIYISRQDLRMSIGDYFNEKERNIEKMHMGLSVFLEYIRTIDY